MSRKEKLYPYEIIKNIILKCAEDESIIGEITWPVVLKYSNKMFLEGKLPKEIDKSLKEDYWRRDWRQGYKILKEVNEIRKGSIKKGSKENLVNTEKEVEKLYTGKETDKFRLIQKLQMNEIIAKKLQDETIGLRNKIDKLEEEKSKIKEKRDELHNKYNKMQTLLFQFMDYSQKKGFPVENIFNTGKTRSTPVDAILASVFSDNPTLGYEFKNYSTKKKQSNVVDLKSKNEEKNRSALDEYGAF
ncbi:hypothetical protein [Peribacillus simplex]|uniref:hypothetical protein n=1 Tax=Peribacillus simplex TaxID=1478 RepID=UPI00119E45F9|nr:hypothetical protein [Peribacillus simplex]